LKSESVNALREELERTRAELREASTLIAAMEQGRFWTLRNAWWALKARLPFRHRAQAGRSAERGGALWALPRGHAWAPPERTAMIDVVVLVEKDTPAVMACLDSIVRSSRPPYRLVIAEVAATQGKLEAFALGQGAQWIAGSTPAEALEAALAVGRTELLVVVDLPVDVPTDWLERLVPYLAGDAEIDGVAPLSPGLAGIGAPWERAEAAFSSRAAFAAFVSAEFSRNASRLEETPRGCLLVRREAISRAMGAPDVTTLAKRLRAAGGAIVLAEDVAVERIDEAAFPEISDTGPGGLVLAGISARLEAVPSTIASRSAGRQFEGKRVLFVLPIMDRGGGANIVLREARAMVGMGVDARVVNLKDFENAFRGNYPDPAVPVAFRSPAEIAALGKAFDAVVATANTSVPWLAPLAALAKCPVLGYYIQDFEPYFYPAGSEGYARALASYTLFPGLVRFAKTAWNAREVQERCGVPCAVIGPSYDTTTFRPRRPQPASPPLRIAAMIRPATPRRQPELTLRALHMVSRAYGSDVDIVLFGVECEDPQFLALKRDFPYRQAGVLNAEGLANLFNDVHVFADFSSHQAMGLTAMEAMACGVAVVVPETGGASSFAKPERNALFVDTHSAEPCAAALSRLVREPGLATELGLRALRDVAPLTPDASAERLLEVLFGHA
jgi:glycosyltransferase involved in cell wall biosynthesis